MPLLTIFREPGSDRPPNLDFLSSQDTPELPHIVSPREEAQYIPPVWYHLVLSVINQNREMAVKSTKLTERRKSNFLLNRPHPGFTFRFFSLLHARIANGTHDRDSRVKARCVALLGSGRVFDLDCSKHRTTQ